MIVLIFIDHLSNYRIRPNYRTVRLGFSKLLEKLLKYVSTYIKGTLKKRSAKDV